MDVEPDMNEDVIQTQEEQMTQPSTQTVGGESQNDHLWGYLNPCLSTTLSRVELYRDALEVKVGRSTTNTVVFPGFKISEWRARLLSSGGGRDFRGQRSLPAVVSTFASHVEAQIFRAEQC
jgi:hypothetical protein